MDKTLRTLLFNPNIPLLLQGDIEPRAKDMPKVILDYGDSLLYDYDVELLEDCCWLNDKLIGFVFEYFEAEQFREIKDKVAFLHPSVSQLVKMTSTNEGTDILESLNLKSKDLVFIPINDNEGLGAGGSHWSLLVIDLMNKECLHFDSSVCSCNEYPCKLVCEIFSKILHLSCNNVITMQCPTQSNGYDCGLYTICFAETTCAQYKLDSTCKLSKMHQSQITTSYVANKRIQIKNLIFKLASNN